MELDNPIRMGSLGNFLRKRNNLDSTNMDNVLLSKNDPSKTLSFQSKRPKLGVSIPSAIDLKDAQKSPPTFSSPHD